MDRSETPPPRQQSDETRDAESADSPVQRASALWRRLRENRAASWIFDLALIALIFGAVSAYQTREMVDTGHLAPDVRLEHLDGAPASLADYRGKKTLVVFWAPWCGVCGAESDNVSRVQSWLGDRAHVVSVSLGHRDRASVEAFMTDHEVDYPVLLGDRAAQEAFAIEAFPTLYVLDAEGHVEHTAAGYTSTLGMLWRTAL